MAKTKGLHHMTDHDDDVTPEQGLPETPASRGSPITPTQIPDADSRLGRTYTLGFSCHSEGQPTSTWAMQRPFASRGNATYHAKKWRSPFMGSFGFMVIEV